MTSCSGVLHPPLALPSPVREKSITEPGNMFCPSRVSYGAQHVVLELRGDGVMTVCSTRTYLPHVTCHVVALMVCTVRRANR